MSRGGDAERQAEKYLRQQGLTLLARNFSCKGGEIDLIMDHCGATVFIEVRLRSNPQFASASESVTVAKQHKIIIAAQHFLLVHNERQQTACRFDVIALAGLNSTPHWVQAAFTG